MSFEVASEFAAVSVALDHEGNSPRLRIEDRRTGRIRFLDALELETLVWAAPEDMALLLDPSRSRWRDRPVDAVAPDVAALTRRVYPALATGDLSVLTEVLAEDFVGHLSPGFPAPIGGRHQGRQAMIDDGWWALGRRFRVRAEPEEWCRADDARMVVVGRYRGRHRDADVPIDAAFAHVWTAQDGRLRTLRQITDTAAWGLEAS